MKLDIDEMRVIRAALLASIDVGYMPDKEPLMQRLLREVFCDIPEPAQRMVEVAQKATPPAPVHNGERNTKITAHGDGYFVHARRKSPFNFYVVEYCELHSHAVMLCEQLDADDSMRFQDIREAKGWDFYSGKAVPHKERIPRERMEPVTFSFDP